MQRFIGAEWPSGGARGRHRDRARRRHEGPAYVVLAEPGDMIILGVRSLEAMNLRVDALRKLVPAGPLLAGVA